MKSLPAFLFLVPALAFADEVFLKGAGTLSGRVIEQTDTIVKVDVGDGIIGVPPSRVERIVKGLCPLDVYDARVAKLGAQDVKGWKDLGRWALDQGLSKQSRDAYAKVVALAPDDAEARKVMGFVNLDGRWVTEEESYKARGYVKYEGEWMTQAQAQVEQASAAAYEAKHEAEKAANEAEIATREADARAEEAEERAREAEERERAYQPVYWGGWGYGVNQWPTGSYSVYR